ncbi:MAG TPA: glycosyltransferase [Rhodopila sp.]|uniref:glycosyltransferase n=1 Tax=Rhodopila sp. TaxID=2480087 RepID=UPI002CD8785C|nr:glycosyltransferase [Rhodopila sp.]HVY14403.1 glycosyltransferase [Rhodopila sp.]
MSQVLRIARIHAITWIDTLIWRALVFARSCQPRCPFLAQVLRRSVLLLWWTATFQLHIHARYWLRARRLRKAEPVRTPLLLLPAPVAVEIDPASIALPLSDQPVVSIIIPTYGQVDFTLRCLASLAAQAPDIPFETIVVDDAAPDPETVKLERVAGIRLLRNATNLGFLRTCNAAAQAARGAFLFFLNNDTEVQPNWLPPLLDIFHTRADAGAVGSRLLYPDGRLQEAGGIIWRDGSAWNFGRHEDPEAPAYTYVREVDYCSGAALMVRRTTFLDMGGFDELYRPAYYEDSDLCMRLRQAGLKTYYQPASSVVHYEGVSHGVDTTVGIKSHQAVNRRGFVRRWAKELAANHYPHGQAVFRARDRAMHRAIVLVVDHYVPTPDRDAGSRTMLAFLRTLTEAGAVVKFWPHNLAYSPGYTEALRGMGIETFQGPMRLDAWIRQHGHELDHVLLSRPEVAEDVLPLLSQYCAGTIVYYGHDLHFARMLRQAALTGDPRLRVAAEAMRQREIALWRRVDLSLYPSEDEARKARRLEPSAAIAGVSPYAFDRFGPERPPSPNAEVLFVGGFGHAPNEDAALWFADAVLPAIRMAVPSALLRIVGSNPTAPVRALHGGGVSVHPNVSDAALAGFYQAARVAVVPLRCGAGVKLKVVEALREGVPLVTTTTGAQGLAGIEDVVAVCDDAQAFSEAVVARLIDDGLWRRASAVQVAYARRHFSRAAMRAGLLPAFGLGESKTDCMPDQAVAG